MGKCDWARVKWLEVHVVTKEDQRSIRTRHSMVLKTKNIVKTLLWYKIVKSIHKMRPWLLFLSLLFSFVSRLLSVVNSVTMTSLNRYNNWELSRHYHFQMAVSLYHWSDHWYHYCSAIVREWPFILKSRSFLVSSTLLQMISNYWKTRFDLTADRSLDHKMMVIIV